MKKLKTILFLVMAVALFYGCVEEDQDDCPPPFNAELTFSYSGDKADPALFASEIDRVTLFVFDSDGQQVIESVLEKSALNAYQGARLKLAPGDYRLICWGNAFDHTELDGCGALSSGRLHHPNYSNQSEIPTNDHVYHGCYSLTVPESGIVSGDVSFRNAHVDMKVYVKGLNTTRAGWPSVEAHNLMPQYDMEMTSIQACGTTYYPELVYNEEHEVLEAIFQVLRFGDTNTVQIEIKDQNGNSKATVSVEDYMKENNIQVESLEEAEVPILIEFTDLGVSVQVPDWGTNVIDPGPGIPGEKPYE